MKLIAVLCASAVLFGVLALLVREIQPNRTEDLQNSEPSQSQSTQQTEQSSNSESTETTDPQHTNKPFSQNDFIKNGEWMTCVTADFSLGVDVSKYQGDIDWEQVAAAGIRFVMIRVGGRGYGQAGNLFADEMAQKNYDGAKAAGLQVGAYFFSQAISAEEAKAEAEFALAQIEKWKLDLPVAFDWEYISDTARTAQTDSVTVTACAQAFCDRIQAEGLEAMIYIRPEDQKLDLEQLTSYTHWVAYYGDVMDLPFRFSMWQYTKTGKVPGISGNVDINIYIPQ